ncbi:Coatomer subunit delta [Forsythia ovata]|uniref:Coatomer subunit delta n=1 Tax=Forsythia ovata TaxID=205694 RepID=A0ABD1VHY2_9LAMI
MEAFEEHDKDVNNEGIGLGSDNNDGCYVPIMQCSSEMEVDEDNIDEYIFHQDDIWSQLEESLMYNDLPTDAGNNVSVAYFMLIGCVNLLHGATFFIGSGGASGERVNRLVQRLHFVRAEAESSEIEEETAEIVGSKKKPILDWNIRYRIALGVARAIAYLHKECLEWVLHCDIKPENILLGDEFCPKVSDFGLAKLKKKEDMMSVSRMRGTPGYMAPEWTRPDPITSKAYSFGLVLLEIVSGSRNFVQLDPKVESSSMVLSKVVLAASIISKSGKALVSRQFVDMSRIRIEGYLAAFPKLVGTGKQHTYIETENVRYVYQPMESLYLLLVTNKQSNILEDLETLRLLSKLVPEYSYSLDEEGIGKTAFEILFAFDEVISLGHKESVTVAQVKQYCEMESHEERLHKLVLQSKINETKDVMKRKASEIDKSKIEKSRGEKGGFMSLQSMGSGRIETGFGNDTSISSSGGFGSGSGFGLSTDVESFSTKSKGRPPASATAPPKGLGMQLGKTQRTNQFLESLKAEGEVIVEDGNLALQILNQDDGLIQVQIETGGNPGILFKTHPNINKELFSNENILGLKDPNRPFPTGQAGDGVCLLRWRMQSADESLVPLSINCWPSVSGNETYVSMEYEASQMFDLQNVVISVPLPALREAPNVQQIDGEWRYDSRNSVLEWSIVLIDNSNRSGSMEFVVPPVDTSAFFPISVRFTATSTFGDLKVLNVIPLRGGTPPKFSQRTVLSTENYQVV